MLKPPLWNLFWTFAQYGNLTFGGGSANIATLHAEVVSAGDGSGSSRLI
jgi:chromate transport protein ChrA